MDSLCYRTDDPGNNSYFLANESCFFHRFADSGFRNKWTGFWSDELKYVEFFAVKAGSEYLSPENCARFEYDGAKAVHTYSIGGGEVTETVFVPKSGPALLVELDSGSEKRFEIELAVNIRKRVENATSRECQLRHAGRSILMANDLGRLEFRLLEGSLDFEKDVVRKVHQPSGEEQSYVVPGRIMVSGKRVVFALVAGQAGELDFKGDLAEKESFCSGLLEGKIRSDNKDLERGFAWSALGVEMLRKSFGQSSCFYAGLPWFQQFWGRDLFWVTQSLLSLGYFSEVRFCLREFAKKADAGRIPNFLSFREKSSWDSLDASLLWLISLEDYVMRSGDSAFLAEMKGPMLKTMKYLFSRDCDSDGFLEHDQVVSETWMDTLRRNGRAVEIQALYYRALCCLENMLSLDAGKPDSQAAGTLEAIKERKRLMKSSFDAMFYGNGFYADRVSGGKVNIRTANALVPLFCGFGERHADVLDEAESRKFTTPAGVRTLAEGERNYSPGAYHEGEVWSLTTAWAAAAEFACGRAGKGWEYVMKLLDGMRGDALGCVGECWNAADMSLTGCGLQLWGSGFIPRLVDEFMLGIRVDAFSKTITVSPHLPPGTDYVEREIFMGGEKVRLTFRRDGGVRCSSKSVRVVKG